jgi:hypothetical protein
MDLRVMEAQREEIAFTEKIALAKLEAVKADERVAELEYQQARWRMDLQNMLIKEAAEQEQARLDRIPKQV